MTSEPQILEELPFICLNTQELINKTLGDADLVLPQEGILCQRESEAVWDSAIQF